MKNQTLQCFFHLIQVLLFLVFSQGCEKYLDHKPDKKLAEVSSIEDARALLDNYTLMNYKGVAASEISAGDMYINDVDLLSQDEYNRRLYLWQNSNVFSTGGYNDWYNTYYVVYVSNTVLKSLSGIDRQTDSANWDDVKGEALVYRAEAYMQAAFAWCKGYDSATSATDMGLPLRFDDNFNTPSVRSDLGETYNNIISDLQTSVKLLPHITIHPLRPCKAAAYGLLARLYLSMRNYTKMNIYCDSALAEKSALLDYNNKALIPSVTAIFPFPLSVNNPEVLHEVRFTSPMTSYAYAKIDSLLYNSYDNNDLRKTYFFLNNQDGSHSFRGSYARSVNLSFSVCTDEVYLMKAEAEARSGNAKNAAVILDSLLSKRYITGTFTQVASESSETVLNKVLQERRKELLMRGLRWMDIKRLNKEGENIGLKRVFNDGVYELSAGSPRFAIPIPDDVIMLSGIKQNPY